MDEPKKRKVLIIEVERPVRRKLTLGELVDDFNAHYDAVQEKHHPQDTLPWDEGEEP